MMERICLVVFFLSEWLVLSTCLLRQYHFVDEKLTWTEAQSYCRQRYTDLATVGSEEERRQLLNTSAGTSSDVWTGLYTEINWRWSDGFNGSGAEYRNWETSQPDFYMDDFCVACRGRGEWYDDNCQSSRQFICSSGTQLDPGFVLVSQPMPWSSAQRHCRENHIDLVTVRNQTENQRVKNLVPSGHFAWIGLFRDPNFYWSDGSNVSSSIIYYGPSPIGSLKVMCGFVSSSGRWRFSSCDRKLPFVCHGPRRPVSVKLSLKLWTSLRHQAEKADFLKKLQDRLKKNGVTGVNLKWRQQPDGQVSHQKRKRKKTEL